MSKDSFRQTSRASPKTKAVKKSIDKFAKLTLDDFDEIEDPQEREQLFNEAMERMKKTIEEIHLRDAMNAKQIQKLRAEIGGLKERIGNLDVDLKSTEKTKELDSNYLLKQEEVLARAKSKTKNDTDSSKLNKEAKKIEDANKAIKNELKQDINTFIGDGGYIEQTRDDIEEIIKYY